MDNLVQEANESGFNESNITHEWYNITLDDSFNFSATDICRDVSIVSGNSLVLPVFGCNEDVNTGDIILPYFKTSFWASAKTWVLTRA